MTDIFEGQPHFDMRDKHATKLRDAALAKMADLMDKSGIDLDDFIAYYDSERLSVSEQIQLHRRKFAHIRKHQENVQNMIKAAEEARRATKQAKAERSTGEGTERNQEVGTGTPKAPKERQQTATTRNGFIKAADSG